MMDKRASGSLLIANAGTNPEVRKLKANFVAKIFFLASLLVTVTACEFITQDPGRSIPTSNPGVNANLPVGTPLDPSQNTYRMTEAIRQRQVCDDFSCDPVGLSHIQYIYDDTTAGAWGTGGLLNRTIEREPDAAGNAVSYRLYIYDAANNLRLDKVAIADNTTSNFHTLHDYFYDDENDTSDSSADVGTNPPETDGYNANILLTAPKLRKEYICSINTANPPASATITTAFPDSCNRFTADKTTSYIYYNDGHLFRKQFDIDNDGDIDHQKVYYYQNGQLSRVDTDNFYNGIIDERNEYETRAFAGEGGASTLRIFLDINRKKSVGVDRTVSYELDYSLDTINGLPVTECYFGSQLNRLDSNYDPIVHGISGACLAANGSPTRNQYLQWLFTWENSSFGCWAGGLDDIDPETRAIRYLCSQ